MKRADTVGHPPSTENRASNVPLLKAQDYGESGTVIVSVWRENRMTNSIRAFFWRSRGWGAIHGSARGRRGVGTAAGSVHNDIDRRRVGTASDAAETRLLTSVRVSSCNRLGQMTHISFAHRKPKKVNQVFLVRNS
jgi:hypothetical protein